MTHVCLKNQQVMATVSNESPLLPDIRDLFQATFVGDAEFLATLLAAARDEFAAVFGRHALTKAVLVLAGAAGRLIGTFHRLSKVKNVLLFKNWSAKVICFPKNQSTTITIFGKYASCSCESKFRYHLAIFAGNLRL